MAENYTKANFCSVLLIKSEIIKAEKIWRAVIIVFFVSYHYRVSTERMVRLLQFSMS